jgi:hypothetical protein
VEEGAAVPDQQHDRRDENGKDNRVAPRAPQSCVRTTRHADFAHYRYWPTEVTENA